MDDATRETLLKTAIDEAIVKGGHVEARYPHHAIVVVKPAKKMHWVAILINVLLTIVTIGAWGIIWAVWHQATRGAKRFRISVDLDGRVMQVPYEPTASDTLVK